MDFAQNLFEKMTEQNRATAAYIQMGRDRGREDAFREVLGWINRNADAHGMAHTESLRALCEGRK